MESFFIWLIFNDKLPKRSDDDDDLVDKTKRKKERKKRSKINQYLYRMNEYNGLFFVHFGNWSDCPKDNDGRWLWWKKIIDYLHIIWMFDYKIILNKDHNDYLQSNDYYQRH